MPSAFSGRCRAWRRVRWLQVPLFAQSLTLEVDGVGPLQTFPDGKDSAPGERVAPGVPVTAPVEFLGRTDIVDPFMEQTLEFTKRRIGRMSADHGGLRPGQVHGRQRLGSPAAQTQPHVSQVAFPGQGHVLDQ